jgi:hypothetical protein
MSAGEVSQTQRAVGQIHRQRSEQASSAEAQGQQREERSLLQAAVSGLPVAGSVLVAVSARQQAPELELVGQAQAQSPTTGSGNVVVSSDLFVPEHTPTPPEPPTGVSARGAM